MSAQSCPSLCDPINRGLPGSTVHGFSQQEYSGELPFPSPWHLPNSGIKPSSPGSPEWQADSLLQSHWIEQSFYQKCRQAVLGRYGGGNLSGPSDQSSLCVPCSLQGPASIYSPLAFESTCQRTIGAVTLSNKLGPAAHCLQNQTHKCR